MKETTPALRAPHVLRRGQLNKVRAQRVIRHYSLFTLIYSLLIYSVQYLKFKIQSHTPNTERINSASGNNTAAIPISAKTIYAAILALPWNSAAKYPKTV